MDGYLVKATKKMPQGIFKRSQYNKRDISHLLNGNRNNPLTLVTNDSKNIESLTLNHFFINWASPNQRFTAMTEKVTNLCAKKKAIKAIVDVFWKKWIKEYVPNLTKRQKLTSYLWNIKVRDLVIIAEDNIEKSEWPLARVIENSPHQLLKQTSKLQNTSWQNYS